MDLNGKDMEESIVLVATSSDGSGLCPLEAPDEKPITEEFLVLPHPGEPGVQRDGTAAPLENPGTPGSNGSTRD